MTESDAVVRLKQIQKRVSEILENAEKLISQKKTEKLEEELGIK